MPNPITQFQIISKSPDETARFYSSLFGWTVDANNPLGYRVLTREPRREFREASGRRRRRRQVLSSSSSPWTMWNPRHRKRKPSAPRF